MIHGVKHHIGTLMSCLTGMPTAEALEEFETKMEEGRAELGVGSEQQGALIIDVRGQVSSCLLQIARSTAQLCCVSMKSHAVANDHQFNHASQGEAGSHLLQEMLAHVQKV